MGPEGMSNREKREKNADEEISAIFFWFRKHKLSTSDQEYLLRKKHFFSLFRVRKPFSRGPKEFIRPFSPPIGGIFGLLKYS